MLSIVKTEEKSQKDKVFTARRTIWMLIYRVFQKKVPAFVLLISRLPKDLGRCFCTIFNSPTFEELKNNNIYILGLKFEKLVTKMWWEHHIWNWEWWGFNQFVFQIYWLPRHLEKLFCTIFNTQIKKNLEKAIFLFQNQNWRIELCTSLGVVETHHFKYGILTTFLSIAFTMLILE